MLLQDFRYRSLALCAATGLLCVLAPARPVFAAEAYLCGSDNVVYVEVEDLERMKQTDPCIASYYGIKLPDPPPTETDPKSPAARKDERRPLPELRGAPSSDMPYRRASARDEWHIRTLAVASPGTDFRNVRIINAGTDEASWFHHSR